jgi:hypothetical protein
MSNPRPTHELQRLVDEAAIRKLLGTYCRGIDRREPDIVRSVFHPDAYDDHGVYRGDVDGFIEFFNRRHEFITMSMHHIGNILIDFESAERAVVETYCFVCQRYSPGGQEVRKAMGGGDQSASAELPMEMLMWVRYVDIVTKRDGEWRIAARKTVWDAMRSEPIADHWPRPGADWIVGKRGDRADCVFHP